ncbi:hypothetical protein BHE74_00011605, partial [Ensete ventricosum]
FPTEWTSRTVSSFILALSANEIEPIEILRGILSVSRGLKDMNEPTGDAGLFVVEKRPISGVEAGLRKRLRKVAVEQPADASGSTARTSADKGKVMV